MFFSYTVFKLHMILRFGGNLTESQFCYFLKVASFPPLYLYVLIKQKFENNTREVKLPLVDTKYVYIFINFKIQEHILESTEIISIQLDEIWQSECTHSTVT